MRSAPTRDLRCPGRGAAHFRRAVDATSRRIADALPRTAARRDRGGHFREFGTSEEARARSQPWRCRFAVLAAARNNHIGEIDDLARQVVEPPQPLEKARILLSRSTRHPRHLPVMRSEAFPPECVRVGDYLLPARVSQFLFDPLPARFPIGRVDRTEAEIIERADDPICSTGLGQRPAQLDSRRGSEDDVKCGRDHGSGTRPRTPGRTDRKCCVSRPFSIWAMRFNASLMSQAGSLTMTGTTQD
jgi:hypothetical protein